jgi:hypothetical protein
VTAAPGPGRLLAAGTVAFTGAATCVGAVRSTWVTGARSAIVVPVGGSNPARIPVAGRAVSGVDLGAGLALVSALVVCVLVVAGVLAQPRTRRNLLSLATALAGVAAGVTLVVAANASSRARGIAVAAPHVRTGVVVTAILAALVAVVACIASTWYARTSPPVRMPEGAPEMEPRDG